MSTMEAVRRVVLSTLEHGHRKATIYLARDLTVKATRRHKRRENERQAEILVTIGRPNYEERKFIESRTQKSARPFPSNIEVKGWKRVDRRRPATRR
jgi:hypothetical protein